MPELRLRLEVALFWVMVPTVASSFPASRTPWVPVPEFEILINPWPLAAPMVSLIVMPAPAILLLLTSTRLRATVGDAFVIVTASTLAPRTMPAELAAAEPIVKSVFAMTTPGLNWMPLVPATPAATEIAAFELPKAFVAPPVLSKVIAPEPTAIVQS